MIFCSRKSSPRLKYLYSIFMHLYLNYMHITVALHCYKILFRYEIKYILSLFLLLKLCRMDERLMEISKYTIIKSDIYM